MEKLSLRVFKILGMTLILTFLLDTGLVVYSAVDAYSKLNGVLDIAQSEIARHNCITDSMVDVVDRQILDIMQGTPISGIIPTGQKNFGSSKTEPIKMADTTHQEGRGGVTNVTLNFVNSPDRVDEEGVGTYGDIKEVEIRLTLRPRVVYFPGTNMFEGNLSTGSRFGNNWGDVILRVNRKVPCLRYLK